MDTLFAPRALLQEAQSSPGRGTDPRCPGRRGGGQRAGNVAVAGRTAPHLCPAGPRPAAPRGFDGPILSTAAPSLRGAPTSHRVNQPLALPHVHLSGAGLAPLGHPAPWDPGPAVYLLESGQAPAPAQPADAHPTPSRCRILSRVSVNPTRREGPNRTAFGRPRTREPCRGRWRGRPAVLTAVP